MLADGFAMRRILVREVSSGSEGEGLLLGNGRAGGHRAAHLEHGVDWVNGGGAGFREGLKNRGDVRLKL